MKGLSKKLLGTAGLVFYAEILVPVFGTSKLAESNARVAVKICIDQLCSQLATDRRDPLPRSPGTVRILIFMLLWVAFMRTGLPFGERWIRPRPRASTQFSASSVRCGLHSSLHSLDACKLLMVKLLTPKALLSSHRQLHYLIFAGHPPSARIRM